MGEGTGVLESSVLSGCFPQPEEQQAVEESGVLPLVLLKPQGFCGDGRGSVQDSDSVFDYFSLFERFYFLTFTFHCSYSVCVLSICIPWCRCGVSSLRPCEF